LLDYFTAIVEDTGLRASSRVYAYRAETLLDMFEDLAKKAQAMDWLVSALQQCCAAARPHGVRLALEPICRYETTLVNNAAQGLELIERVGADNLGLLLDTFHMNIDEASIPDAFRNAGKYVNHIHLADSNRAAPGKGHLDFVPILQAIKDIEYTGYLSFELLPASADPFGTLRRGGGKEFYDDYTLSAIRYMKRVEERLH